MALDSPLTELLEEAFPSGWERSSSGPAHRLRCCLQRRDAGERTKIAEEVDALLRRGLCDMQMSEVIAFELGAHLRPEEMGLTPSEWLTWVGREAHPSPQNTRS